MCIENVKEQEKMCVCETAKKEIDFDGMRIYTTCPITYAHTFSELLQNANVLKKRRNKSTKASHSHMPQTKNI